MRVSFYFERSCPEQHPRATLCIEAARAPLERALDPGRPRPRPRRGPRESWHVVAGVVASGVVASGKLQELSL
jgi:hypothetical protein